MEFNIHHIAISVSNIQKAIEFYSLFGFKEVASYKDENLEIKHLYLNGFILEVFSFKDYKKREILNLWEDLKILGVKHFALKVNDIEKARDFFIEKGIISEDTKINKGRTGILYFFIKDPDGNFVEIIQDDRSF